MELYKKYRPQNLDGVVGQNTAVSILQACINNNSIPHTLLFSGPSGVGKTTIARCMRKILKCYKKEFHELNIADIRGIDNIRDIRKSMMNYPLQGKTKIWLLDEVSELTSSAQKALLKMLEDTPNHVYFILATTDPQKLIKPIRTRCTEISLKPIKDEDLFRIIDLVVRSEGYEITDNVYDKIVDCSDGSARKALVLLDVLIKLDNEDEMLEAIEKSTQEKQAIELCRLLLNSKSWKDISLILKELEGQEPESIRRMVLGYMRSCLLKGGYISKKAYYIMTCFERNFFDTGKAGLAMACWESISQT